MQRRSTVRSRLRHWGVGLAIAAAVAPVGVAFAEKIQGKITGYENLENPVWAESKDPKKHGYSFRELVPTVPARFRKLFPHIPKEVCLAALSENAQAAQPPVL